MGNRKCRRFSKNPEKPTAIQQKRALPWPEPAHPHDSLGQRREKTEGKRLSLWFREK